MGATQSGRLDRAAALLAFGTGTAVIVIPVASSAPATATAAFEALFTGLFAALETFPAAFGGVVTRLAVARAAVFTAALMATGTGSAAAALVTAASASTAVATTSAILALLAVAILEITIGSFDFGRGRTAEEALEPGEKSAGLLGFRSGSRFAVAREILAGFALLPGFGRTGFETARLTLFARVAGLLVAGFARLKRTGFARLARFLRALVAALGTKRRAFVAAAAGFRALGRGVLAPADGGAFHVFRRKDVEFRAGFPGRRRIFRGGSSSGIRIRERKQFGGSGDRGRGGLNRGRGRRRQDRSRSRQRGDFG